MRILVLISSFLFLGYLSAEAQKDPLKSKRDSKNSSLRANRDSIPSTKPLKNDSLHINETIDIPSSIIYSQEPLESEIEYFAEDSMHLNVAENKIYLFGNAFVKYEDFELNAGYIIFDQKNNLVIAEGITDSLGNTVGTPEFKDDEQEFKAKKIKYNYKTEKGIITEVTSQQNDLYIHSGTLKYQKSKNLDGHNHAEDVICSENSLFTTCDHHKPHFGIRSKKQKIIADKMIVVGPSNLEIAGITTPLWIPFGFFPMTKGKRSGLIIPKDYENSPTLGFGIKNIGYYWALNDKVDFQATAEIYTRGTWRINSRMRYNVKYKYNGSLAINYAWNYQQEVPGEIGRGINKNLAVNWTFNQDRAANPNYDFSAKVDFSINNAQSQNSNDYENVYNNQTNSRISFTKKFAQNKMRFDAAITHAQVKSTRSFTMDLPNLKFKINQFSPFKRRTRTGPEKWYEKINMSYSADAISRVTTKDTLLFTKEVFDDIKYGVRHKADLGASFRIFKHFNFSPSIRYGEEWYFESLEKVNNTYTNIELDSIIDPDTGEFLGFNETEVTTTKLDTIYTKGFLPVRTLSAGFNISTDIFSTLRFKKGRLQGIRYTMKPSIGFSYTPDYTQDGWGHTDSYIENERERDYSRYEGNVFRENYSSAGLQMNMTYGVTNILEGKWKTRKDSTGNAKSKIIKLFDNLSFNGSYNFAADSLNFSPITGRTTIRVLKNITTVTLSAAFSPYVLNEDDIVINKTVWDEDKRLLRFDYLNTNTRTNISWRQLQDWFGLGKKKSSSKDNKDDSRDGPKSPNGKGGDIRNSSNSTANQSTSFFSDVKIGFNFNLRTNKDGTEITTNNIKLQGAINLSPKWRFVLSNIGYDFKRKSLVYPAMSVVRDLHCWEMAFSWQPDRGTYSFSLYVKPGSLDFISIPWQKNQFDSNFGGKL